MSGDTASSDPASLSPHRSRAPAWILAAILIVWCALAAQFIWRTSFLVDGRRYFALADDEMISMRYARNLAAGHGLVWNVGEPPVEGITNPLWTLYMAGWHLLPIPPAWMSLAVQVSAAVCLLANLFVVERIARIIFGPAVAVAAVALTAFYYPLNTWGLMGAEVCLVTLLYSLAVLRVVRTLGSSSHSDLGADSGATAGTGAGRYSRPSARGTDISIRQRAPKPNTSIGQGAPAQERADPWVHLLLGLATLVRIDAFVGFFAVELFLLLFDRRRRAAHLRWAILTAVIFGGGQTLARWWYYGELLPNTYYLKMTGFPPLWRMARGAHALLRFMAEIHWVLFFAPFVILLFRRDRAVALLVWVFLFQVVYSIYVGGDAWERHGGSNRFVSVAMPGFFVLLAGSIGLLLPRVARSPALRGPGGLGAASSLIPPQADLRERPAERPAAAVPWKPSVGEGSGLGLRHAGFVGLVVAGVLGMNTHENRPVLDRVTMLAKPWFGADRDLQVRTAQVVERITLPDARVGVVFAGTMPYFCDRLMLDLLGRSDHHIARQPMHITYEDPPAWMPTFMPGHLKWDYGYVFGEVKPDLIIDRWGYDQKELPESLRSAPDAYRLTDIGVREAWLRVDSTRIRWSELGLSSPPGYGENGEEVLSFQFSVISNQSSAISSQLGSLHATNWPLKTDN